MQRKRLVYRADDVGYTKTCNDGVFKALDQGSIITSVDVMLETPGSEDALYRLRDYPWLSIGWHCHLWGSPVADHKLVPHMIDEEGRFIWRHKHNHKDEVPYEEAYIEFEAQIERCIRILGKAPDTTQIYNNMPMDQARWDICAKYGIAVNVLKENNGWAKNIIRPEEYKDLDYQTFSRRTPSGKRAGENGSDFDLAKFNEYQPEEDIMAVTWQDEEIIKIGGHPGFLDDYIFNESSCNIHRVRDVVAVTNPKVLKWISDNNIELVNQRDVLNGTNEFQEHLRAIGSPLAVRY
ncbi:MAG: ChbG/HpnK family deacetylase [Erysipelotrichaceae bacterium]|nr:ChbG/HpnK family deacetylase [Erysipelotrichaceae bacterium]